MLERNLSVGLFLPSKSSQATSSLLSLLESFKSSSSRFGLEGPILEEKAAHHGLLIWFGAVLL